MLKEFREFAMRGNVMDLAVGVIIGAAFGKIITSLVDDVIMPVVGLFTGGIDFSERAIPLSADAALRWGAFVQNIIDFIIVALIVFLIVRAMNRLKRNVKRRNSSCARRTDRHDLPGPHDFTESCVDHWPSTGRALDAAHRHDQEPGSGPRRGTSVHGWHPERKRPPQ